MRWASSINCLQPHMLEDAKLIIYALPETVCFSIWGLSLMLPIFIYIYYCWKGQKRTRYCLTFLFVIWGPNRSFPRRRSCYVKNIFAEVLLRIITRHSSNIVKIPPSKFYYPHQNRLLPVYCIVTPIHILIENQSARASLYTQFCPHLENQMPCLCKFYSLRSHSLSCRSEIIGSRSHPTCFDPFYQLYFTLHHQTPH